MRAATEYTVARMASLRVGKQRFEGHAIMTIKAVDHGRTAEGVFTLGSDVRAEEVETGTAALEISEPLARTISVKLLTRSGRHLNFESSGPVPFDL